MICKCAYTHCEKNNYIEEKRNKNYCVKII